MMMIPPTNEIAPFSPSQAYSATTHDLHSSNALPPSVAETFGKVDGRQIELAGLGSFARVIKVGPIEKRISERLGHHRYILRYYGEYQRGNELANGLPNGLVLQYHSAGTLLENLALSKYSGKRIQWPVQAAEALQYVHSKNMIHGDIGSRNFLIQEDGILALADFGGSMINETPAVVSCSTRYARPCHFSEESDSPEKDDLFALGTVLYEISVGHQLYADKSSREIWKLLRQDEFPDLHAILAQVRMAIGKCWSNQYQNAGEVLDDLRSTSWPKSRPVIQATGVFSRNPFNYARSDQV